MRYHLNNIVFHGYLPPRPFLLLFAAATTLGCRSLYHDLLILKLLAPTAVRRRGELVTILYLRRRYCRYLAVGI